MGVSDRVIRASILLILIVSPLAFGAVYRLVYGGIQMLVFSVFLLYGWQLYRLGRSDGKNTGTSDARFFFSRYPFAIPFLLWLAFVLFQLVPMPPELLRMISKNAFNLYATLLDGGVEWKSISLSPYDTWQSFLQAAVVGLLFYMTIVSRPSSVAKETKRGGIWGHLIQGPTGDRFFNCFLVASLLLVAFEACYGLTEYLTGYQHIFVFARSEPATGAAGTFVNRNHFANYLLLFFPILFSWFALRFRPSEVREKGQSSFSGHGFFLALVLTVVVVGIILSHSRMAIATALLVTFLLVLSFLFSAGSKKAVLLLLLLLALAAVVLVYLDPGFSLFQFRVSSFAREFGANRLRVWRESLQIIRDFPWMGTGLETFQFMSQKYSSVPITLRYTHAHNDWVELLVETGIVGFVLITLSAVLFFATFLTRLRRLDSALRPLGVGILVSLVAFLVHSIAEFNFHIPANAYAFAIVAAMGVRLVESARVGE